MNILITGGAGYIGSHVVKQLLESNVDNNIFVVDNLSTGSIDTINVLKKINNFCFFNADISEVNIISSIIIENNIDTILHFAASIVVPESVKDPLKYYCNNTSNTIQLVNLALKHNIKKFIFSSTASVYGEQKKFDFKKGIDENFPANPINRYGFSKLMSEQVIKDASRASNQFKYIIFRYFNVAGADINNNSFVPRIRQSFPNATHLIKIASECASLKREKMYLFGNDYETQDGTCIRDYIHVDDLASAHIEAIEYLECNESDTFNLGYGHGYSAKEVIDVVKKISKVEFNVEISNRRQGDPSILISNNEKVLKKTNWRPKYDNLSLICNTALAWEKKI